MKDIGLFLLGIWLVVYGLTDLADLHFVYDDVFRGALAIVAGVLVIIRR
jgi:hypothetical protein